MSGLQLQHVRYRTGKDSMLYPRARPAHSGSTTRVTGLVSGHDAVEVVDASLRIQTHVTFLAIPPSDADFHSP
jgi:hypothetical protein